jgi:hypothetical protein
MITLLTTPAGVLPVGSPIWLQAKTDNYQRLAGPSQAYFFSNSLIADGDKLSFRFGGNQYTLVFKTTPDVNNPFEVPFDNAGNVVTAQHLALVRCLSQHFTFTAITGIYFTAKEIDKVYDITFLPALSSPKFSAAIFNANYTAAKVGFKGNVELFLQADQGGYRNETTPIAVLDADPHREGAALANNEDYLEWEFQEDLRSYIQPTLPVGGAYIGKHGVLVHYWFKYWESYGSPVVPTTMAASGAPDNYYQALLARLPFHENGATLTEQLAAFNDDYIMPASAATRKFLTNTPNNKRTAVGALEYLSIYVNDYGTIYTEVTLYYEDGTTTVLDKGGYAMSAAENNNVYYVATGFAQLGLQAASTSDLIYKYEVRVIKKVGSVKTYLSAAFTYVLDRKSYVDECTLLFLGDLGNWDTARFVSTRSESIEVSSVDGVASRAATYSTSAQRYIKTKTIKDRIISFNTGYKREEEAKWLNELSSSEYVYLYENGQFLPIAIDNKGGLDFGDKAADLFGGGFEGRIALTV